MLLPNGEFHDYVLPAYDVPSLVDSWSKGVLGTFNDCTMTVEWLDDARSAETRATIGIPEGR
jgi:hypothetical protein